jgi:CBS domain containing-hemolysin-like protein
MIPENFPIGYLVITWLILVLLSSTLGIYRTLVDRIRSGLVATPSTGNRITNIFTDCLKLPNHERPFHVEAAFTSSLQVFFGFFVFAVILSDYAFSGEKHLLGYFLSFLIAIAIERLSSWMYPKKITQTRQLDLHLKIGLFPVLLVKLICKPLTLLMHLLEKSLQSSSQKIISAKEEGSEVAGHIRIVGREGTNLDPDILEIMGNTIEMSQLKVNDVMIPRNQVQILDTNDSFSTNLEIAKSCGHTRLPLCNNDLDQCLGIVHVKYAFQALAETGENFELQKITKAPALLSSKEPLPVALKRMMRLKVHMALVRDEFGGIDGVITLEDILEEVVGEIQDEFDADEKSIEIISENKWKVSGLVPVHDLPTEIRQPEQEDDMATVGGLITGELGRIPEKGEVAYLLNLKVTILDADDTRVLSMEIESVTEKNLPTSEGTE